MGRKQHTLTRWLDLSLTYTLNSSSFWTQLVSNTMHSSSNSFDYSQRLFQTLSKDTTLAAPCVRYWKLPRQRATMYPASHRSTTHTQHTRKRRIHHANSWQNKVLTLVLKQELELTTGRNAVVAPTTQLSTVAFQTNPKRWNSLFSCQ